MSDDESTQDTTTTAGPPDGAAPARPRRRRAASRPAGPPAEAPPAPAQPDPEPEPAVEEIVEAEVAVAAAEEALEEETEEAPAAPPEPPVSAATRNRRRRKAAAPDPEPAEGSATDAADEPAAEPADAAPAPEADAEPAPAVGVPAALGVPLFQAPDPAAATPRRRRAATRPAGAATAADAPDDTTDKTADAPRTSADKAAGKGTTRRSRKPAAAEVVEEPADADDPADAADAADPAEATDADASADDGDADEAARRRRRRRGGRRRRKGGADDADTGAEGGEDEAGADDESSAAADGSDDPEGGDDDAEGGSSSSSRRRRRRRRGGRGGESAETSSDDPPNTVVRVRASRSQSSDVTAVKGSTRLEAKKQRRREGRDAGRRRAPILTEAEFLARREDVDRVMVVRQVKDRVQIGVLEDGVLVEHYVNKAGSQSLVGNVYLGKVQNVLPSMEAAFVDIGRGRNAVLYAGEVNWDAAGLDGQAKRIESALKSGDSVLVQVTKDPLGHKGARLTSQISLPGRYLVYVPDGSMTGISRKLPDNERTRLKRVLRAVVPEDAGVIVRTAAEGASEEELERDVSRLAAQWTDIKAKSESSSTNAPALLYGEPDLAIRVVRDIFNEDFARLVVSGDDVWDTLHDYLGHVAPDLAARVTKHVGPQDLFTEYRIDEQLAKALDRKVWLPSGGSLVIDRTEAMTVVDVNTGKFTGQGGNLEETVTKNNLEAAEEIVRQLRLRDIGGIIVVDFIDMVLESNRDLVLRRLVECLGRDRTKHQVAEVTSLGLVQMTRKRIGQGLLETFSEPCEHCNGRGLRVHVDPVEAKGGAGEPAAKRRRGRKDPADTMAKPAGPAGELAAVADADETAEAPADGAAEGDLDHTGGEEPDVTGPAPAEVPEAPEGPAAAEDHAGQGHEEHDEHAHAPVKRSRGRKTAAGKPAKVVKKTTGAKKAPAAKKQAPAPGA